MLINQDELKTLCLTTPEHEKLTAQVINQLNGISDPVLRYATANALLKVFQTATAECGAAAVGACLEHQVGMDNKQFVHKGLTFSVDYKCEYDYYNNDFFKDGTPIGYRAAMKQIELLKKQLSIAEKERKAAEEKIELVHPQMQPINPRWTMKFYMKELIGSFVDMFKGAFD